MKIRDKLLLLLSILLVPLIYFAASALKEELAAYERLKQEEVQLIESEKLSTLVHAFQRERALMLAASGDSAGFLLRAKAQRSATDAAMNDLKEFLLASGRTFPDLTLLNELPRYRNNLDKKKFDPIEFRNYSTNVVVTFINKLDANATGVTNPALARQLMNFKNLAQAKIQFSRVRSLLMKALQEQHFSTEDYALVRTYMGFYTQAISDFNRYADPKTAEELLQMTNSPAFLPAAGLLQQIESNPDINLSSLNAAAVFNQFSESIDALRELETRLITNIKAQVQDELNRKQAYLITLVVIVLAVLLLTVLLSFFIVNIISTSLVSIRTAAERIKAGATDVQIDVDSKDEIGEVAAAFKGVVHKTVSLTRVAEAIGQGRYDVDVEVQSTEDVLSYAIRDMKDNLSRFTTENANRNWILTGSSDLTNLISGENNLQGIAEKVVAYLCSYTGAEAGLLYLLNDNQHQLMPVAGQGLELAPEQYPSFELGSGMVGLAARERKIRVLDEVPENYLRIKSGLASIEPASIAIVPLIVSKTVVGVVELCSRRPFGELEQQFFRAVAEKIAVTIHTLKAHLQTQELLYETQNQAEELETQQEELRQLNAELKASEEELRVNQEELQEKNAELEEKAQLMEEQYQELQAKNKALEDAREAIELKIQQVETVSRYKSEFLANMSHELRTPLNSILILSRLLADNQDKTLTPKQIDHAQIIHQSGNDLLKLINEILDLSKIESGMIRLETEEVKLADIHLEPLFNEIATRKNIRYTEEHVPGVFDSIITDRFRLEQILKNFIGNALKFTSEGGEVKLTVYPVTKRPFFKSESLREEPEVVAFAVRDTGIGIPKDKQDLIFEAFQQADASTTRKYGGTGLGLTISKELASLLGGELQLESEEGKGSTFTLYLPRVLKQEEKKAPVPATQAIPAAHSPSALQAVPSKSGAAVSEIFTQTLSQFKPNGKNNVSVLIVEDDKGFSDILADFAGVKNFKVYQAYTGQEGLQLAREKKPDAILLDIQLPDISGWEVLQKIREEKELRHINVHVMSAYDKEITGEYMQNEEYLPKPVTLEMLNKAFSSIAGSTESTIETILIVEDNEVENKAVAELLQAHGLKSTSAYSAEEAEQVLAKQKIDCIILDLNLPGMKGYDWMKKIKTSTGLSDIPIIIYSGKDLSEEEEARLKEFANTIIIKNEYSYLRLLDEVQLFLHKVNQKLPAGNDFKMKLHVPEEILRNKKALVVDDDVRNIYSLSSLLELQGMEVAVAYNGVEALEKLNEDQTIDIVLMDVMMPEMDGIEAIKQIRKKPRFRNLPIISLTAKAMKEDKQKCLDAGASDYIPKPVDTERLLTLMRVWLYEA